MVTEAGSYLRLIDFCITQLKAQGPSRTCNESKEEEEEGRWGFDLALEADVGPEGRAQDRALHQVAALHSPQLLVHARERLPPTSNLM